MTNTTPDPVAAKVPQKASPPPGEETPRVPSWAGPGAAVFTTLTKDSVDPVPSRMGFLGHLSFTLTFLPRVTRLACLQGANSLGPIPTPTTPSPYSTLLPRAPVQGGSGESEALAGPPTGLLPGF